MSAGQVESAREPTEVAREPQAIHRLFEQFANAGDLPRLMSLYEGEATLVSQPGEVATGDDAVRGALGQLLDLGVRFQVETRRVVRAGDVALLSAHWAGTAVAPDGKELTMSGTTAEVARRQVDGTWLMVVDDPYFLS
ncbi:MAG: DUF4440 domain-containing protein [Actinomycetota bacterium]|nr:DUF4440 domain-containing protein [Actinomycetota bacterium]